MANGDGAKTGVAHGHELLALADAIVARDRAATEAARDEIVRTMGAAAAVDAACVVGNFECMNRIADATGIALDAAPALVTTDIQQEMGLRRFASAGRTRELPGWQRGVGRALSRLAHAGLTLRGRLRGLGSRGRS